MADSKSEAVDSAELKGRARAALYPEMSRRERIKAGIYHSTHEEERFRRKNERVKQRKQEKRAQVVQEREQLLQGLSAEERAAFWASERERVAARKLAEKQQEERLAAATLSGPQLVIDLAFADEQDQRARRSLLTQVALSMNRFKQAERPLGLHLASFDGAIADTFRKNGAANWKIGLHAEPVLDAFAHVPASNVVYLSPDGEEELQTLSPDCVYVIGGIVDKVIKRNMTASRAASLGVRCARLPLSRLAYRASVLNVDVVLHLLLRLWHHLTDLPQLQPQPISQLEPSQPQPQSLESSIESQSVATESHPPSPTPSLSSSASATAATTPTTATTAAAGAWLDQAVQAWQRAIDIAMPPRRLACQFWSQRRPTQSSGDDEEDDHHAAENDGGGSDSESDCDDDPNVDANASIPPVSEPIPKHKQ